MKTETTIRVELHDLISFIMEETGKTYNQVENALPHWVYEGNYWLSKDGGNSDGEIFFCVREWLRDSGINRVLLYVDC